jgi:TonB family protein
LIPAASALFNQIYATDRVEKMNFLVQHPHLRHRLTQLLLLLCAVLIGAGKAQATLDTRGLAVYTETSRDIYIAGLLLPSATNLSDVLVSPGPKSMEYRIATRRISGRGFTGMILLQAELGSASRASAPAINALAELKTKMKSALKKGDQFVIALSADNTTSFHLNGTELLQVKGAAVFDFFLAGWVGASSSALMRQELLAERVAEPVLARFEALQPSSERVALITAWMAPPAPKPEPKPAPVKATVAKAEAKVEAPAKAETVAVVEEEVEEKVEAKVAVEATPTPLTTPAEDLAETAEPPPEEQIAAQMDDREYQQQLSLYVSDILVKVFSKVKYPRRAVKKRREGKVELLLYMDADGELLDLALDNSSGYRPLDEAAQTAVRKAAPFPELTEAAREEFLSENGDSYIMSIPITFRLQQ